MPRENETTEKHWTGQVPVQADGSIRWDDIVSAGGFWPDYGEIHIPDVTEAKK